MVAYSDLGHQITSWQTKSKDYYCIATRYSSVVSVCTSEVFQADVVVPIGDESCAKATEDYLTDGEVICYCCVVTIRSAEEDTETPLGRLAIEWKRADGVSTVRSVVPLCRVPLIQCPVSITGTLLDPRAATVRHPIRVAYCIRSHSRETIELTASFDLADVFMFCGEKRKTFHLMPFDKYSIVVVVMALTAGRLPFPKIALKSPEISDDTLQHTSRALPANLFVLTCEPSISVTFSLPSYHL
ncbi:hypothetical protein Y032_0010g979 [Ancylostoma ceylanicum]|uniref:TRAPPC10/Trs130 C-terminal domain-containing protein n=1 Tax=Ancylostoma ceylanicum TaxID=53326 RepID=A0A016VIF2_9BILA|nr:hypothetical protein Y032_0010g979 [Ancylostoma ceylanicum]